MAKQYRVLLTLHPGFDLLDHTGPLEFLSYPKWSDPGTSNWSTFALETTAVDELTTAKLGISTIKRQIRIEDALSCLADYDILLIPGGSTEPDDPVLKSKEILGLVEAFTQLPPKVDGSTRTLISICTGAVILAQAGILQGLTATTHPGIKDQFETLTEQVSGGSPEDQTKIVWDYRYVVNQTTRFPKLRIVTSGGISCGLDATVWLINELAGKEVRERALQVGQYNWNENGLVLP